MEDWDPLAVNGPMKKLWDEYDEFIPPLASAIGDDAGADTLQQMLFEFEASGLGLSEPNLSECRAAAEKLARLKNYASS
jgi:hypothetical protein